MKVKTFSLFIALFIRDDTQVDTRLYLTFFIFILYDSTEYGIYGEKCGLDNVLMSWGHDGKVYAYYYPKSI